jgi:hypothetical protein
MENSPKRHNTLEAMLCRRRARRTTLPVEVEFTRDSLTVSAVIRDVSLNDDGDSASIGIGLFHNDALPLDENMSCRTVSPSEQLPVESTVILMWTRHFGGDGFLSGGRMTKNPSADDQNRETPDTQRQPVNTTHEEHGDS